MKKSYFRVRKSSKTAIGFFKGSKIFRAARGQFLLRNLLYINFHEFPNFIVLLRFDEFERLLDEF